MNLKSTWSILEESFDLLGNYGFPAMDSAASELALAPAWFSWVASAWLFGSDLFTSSQFMQMFPYGLAQVNEERFNAAVEQGFLSAEEGGFRATASGLDAARHIFETADQSIAHLRPLPDELFQVLVNLLYRLAEASFAMPGTPPHFLLDHKRNLRKIKVTESINYFERYVSELQGFRDDMYTATWGAHHVAGHTWETFDQLTERSALTLVELHKHLGTRGVTKDVHAADLKQLIKRGWAVEDSGVYRIISAGKQVRAEVEMETERLFFMPWSCLNESEQEELSNLSKQLRDRLQETR